jgi:co-chaperonin GroES (HSP10)
MSIKVCGHRLLIRPDPLEKEHKVEGTNLVLALAKDEKLYRSAVDSGVVLQIGPTAWMGFGDSQKWCEVGDRVQYHRYSGKFVVDPETDEEFVVVNDDDIHLIVLKGKE